MQIAVFGAGAWGTALAIAAAGRHDVLLWARDAGQAAAMRQARLNARYLPGAAFPASLRIEADAALARQHALTGLAIVATPMAGLRETLGRLVPSTRVLWLCKGFESGSGLLGHQIAAEVLPQAAAGVLSGPSFAQEVAAGRPTALVAASRDQQLLEIAVQALHSDQLRIYTSPDPVGVELGGAVKNVLAIATGIADGLGLGANARAALITRGLAEMTRLGVASGARAETFTGLSGLGDLVLTATGELSRNRQVGLGLARGEALQPLLARLGHVAEGVHSAAAVVHLAGSLGVEMPLAAAVHEVLERRCTPAEAVQRLMQRDARPEA